MKNLGISVLLIFSIQVFYVSCTAENTKNETFLDKVEDIVWTGGTNFNHFKVSHLDYL